MRHTLLDFSKVCFFSEEQFKNLSDADDGWQNANRQKSRRLFFNNALNNIDICNNTSTK